MLGSARRINKNIVKGALAVAAMATGLVIGRVRPRIETKNLSHNLDSE